MSNLLGKPAPSFTLFDTDKKAVSLSEFKGQNQGKSGAISLTGFSQSSKIALDDTVRFFS